MAEYIEREAVYEKAYWHGKTPDFDSPYPDGVEAVDIADVDDIPAADVVEVKRGRWEAQDETLTRFMCTNCQGKNYDGYENFCPNCGADMRED